MINEEITVFYGVNSTDKLYDPPVPVFSDTLKNEPYAKKLNNETGVFKCPAINDYYKNTFAIPCPVDYKIQLTDSGIFSEDYDQIFFDETIRVRSVNEKFFSFKLPKIWFFADTDSLYAESLSPTLSPKLIPNALYIQGTYDIANHFRKMELAIAIRNNLDVELEFNRGDHLYYLKFLTDKKIKLRRFYFTPEILEFIPYFIPYKDYTKKVVPLQEYYKRFRSFGLKNKLLKLLKNAALD